MRTRALAAIFALVVALFAPAVAQATDPAPTTPPSVAGLCATANDYLWTISTEEAGLAAYDVEYSTSFKDWALPAVLSPDGHGKYSATVAASKGSGTTLYARWAASPELVGSSSAPNTTACAPGSIVMTKTVQGGTAKPADFDFTITYSAPDPPFAVRGTTHATSGVATVVQAGNYVVAENPTNVPAGYLWKSITCGSDTSTDPQHPRMIVWVDPGSTVECVVVDHYGPTLSDSIAPGINRGTAGFGTSSVVVPKGTAITYLVRTDPNLAGKSLQIWTRTKTGTWKLTATRAVASDGTLHYYAKISAWTGFLAKWPGDSTFVASSSPGRSALASSGGETRLAVTCDEFMQAQAPDTGKAVLPREVWMRVGETVTLTLCSNASTGFRWGTPAYNHTALRLLSHKYVPPKKPLAGAAGTETWTFKALKSATSSVVLAYSQPWAGGQKNVWKLQLTVHSH